ncbi:MAG: ribosomal protein S18-alanine N-acetyltransferase [bacterium]
MSEIQRTERLKIRWNSIAPGAEFEFRPLFPEDAKELAAIELKTFATPWSEVSLRNCLEACTIQGEAVILHNRIVGYIITQCVCDEGHILNLAVQESFRHLGLGKSLLQRFQETAKSWKITSIYLEVRSSNLIAQRLYFSMGYAPVAVRKRYYPDGEDALILLKHLTNGNK